MSNAQQVPGFVNEFISKVLVNEGGYQDSDKDTGNVVKEDGTVVGTNLGITPYTLASYRGVPVSSITVEDMKDLTEQEAREIYANEYYLRPKIDTIPDLQLQENVFDMAVNSGPSAAITILQRLAGAEEDGLLGPNTIAKVEEAGIDTNQYSDGRDEFYQAITESNPDNEKFIQGWLNRSDKYRVADSAETVQAEPQEDSYVVQPGDNLTQISARLGVDMEDLMRTNNILDANRIQVGQELFLPVPAAPVQEEEEDSLFERMYDYGRSQIIRLFD